MWIRRRSITTGTRVISLFVAFYLLTAFAFVATMFSVVGQEIESNVKADIDRETRSLLGELGGKSLDILKQRMEKAIDSSSAATNIYMLRDRTGTVVISNYPYPVDFTAGWHHLREIEYEDTTFIEEEDEDEPFFEELTLYPESAHDEGYIARVVEWNGYTILVGRTLDRIDETKGVISRVGLMSVLLAILFAIFGGFWFQRFFLRRIETINDQCRDIRRSGDLTKRIPNPNPSDEYGLLTANINAMLEGIDKSVKTVQAVSDDIAHDLRTPLARVKYGLETAETGPDNVDALKRAIRGALAETDRLLAIFSSTLRISQINAERRKSKFTTVDLSEIIERLVEAYAPANDDLDTAIKAIGLDNDCIIWGDADMLAQVLSNLIENALQHGRNKKPKTANITLTLSKDVEGVNLKVNDLGTGMPSKDISKIFDKFFRAEASRTTQGNGLGMALVKAILDIHGATVKVENTYPGLAVSISFPSTESMGS